MTTTRQATLSDLLSDNAIDLTVPAQDTAPFVTITHGIRGYFAMVVCWDAECGEYLPEQSGFGSYATREAAYPEARDWAEAEEIAFKP